MNDGWELVPSLTDLQSGELQIWRIDLIDATKPQEIYRKHLSAEEVDRSERLRAEQVRTQFLVARTCLRMLLGNILKLDPKSVPITLNAFGKPETPPSGGHPLHFNLTHSRETILIALSRKGPVGIDLEYLDRQTEILEVARNFFHPDEFHQIAAIADLELRRRGFFHCWTRKEAVIKADGRGLSLPLTAFKVPVLGSAAATRVIIAGKTKPSTLFKPETSRTEEYFVSDMTLGDGIAGAFATAVPHPQPRKLVFPFAVL